ncbi:MAG: hypothetical protein V4666_08440 [Bacteroidota bacterium]
MEHLFTEKGKKYAVINKVIGTGQIICREVMINKENGEEVLRNDVETLSESLLYNSPVESYYEKEERKIKERYESVRNEYETKINGFRKKNNQQDEVSKDFYQIRKRLLEYLIPDSDPMIQLIDFVTGNFEYVVIDSYDLQMFSRPKFFEYMSKYDGMRGIIPNYASNDLSKRKLVLRQYSDGSGSYDHDVLLYKTKKQANSKIKELIEEKLKNNYGFNMDICLKAIELGIEIPNEKIKEKMSNAKKQIDYYKGHNKDQIDNYTKELKDWQELFNNTKP